VKSFHGSLAPGLVIGGFIVDLAGIQRLVLQAQTKKEQDYDLLMARIKQAGAPVLSLRRALSPCATDRPVWHARVDRPISMKILDDSPIFH